MNEFGSENETERIFVVIGHRVRTDARFNLNDLCGSTGRLDILLRTINSSFLLSNGIRRNVRLYLVLQGEPEPTVSIRLMGNELKYLNPDERSTGSLIRQALITIGKSSLMEDPKGEKEGRFWIRSTPGIYVSKKGFDEIVEQMKGEGRIPVYLHETGEPVLEMDRDLIEKAFIVLGDQFDLSEKEESILGEDARKISLGPRILHTDHCVILIHNALDLHNQ